MNWQSNRSINPPWPGMMESKSLIPYALLMAEAKNSKKESVFAIIQDDHFDLIVMDNSNLRFHNKFEYSTEEDFIYFLLFTAEQLELNPEEFDLILKGKITEEDALFKLAYKYVRNSKIENSFGDHPESYLLINSFS